MMRTIKLKPITATQKRDIMNLGIDYGFEQALTGGKNWNGFVLERDGKVYSKIEYREYVKSGSKEPYAAEVDFDTETSTNGVMDKQSLTRITEIAKGTRVIMDAVNKIKKSKSARISGDGVWRSRLS